MAAWDFLGYVSKMYIKIQFHTIGFQLLEQIRPLKLSLETEALVLLKKYFVGSRRARQVHDGSKAKADNMPLRALQTLYDKCIY